MLLECENWGGIIGFWPLCGKNGLIITMTKILLATSEGFEKCEIGGRRQMYATTEVPLSKMPNSQILKWGPAMSCGLIQGCTLPLPIRKLDRTQHTPLDPERE